MEIESTTVSATMGVGEEAFHYRYITGSLTEYLELNELDNVKYIEEKGVSVSSFKDFKLVKYKKERLTPDNVSTLGLWRSVVLRNGRIVSVAPTKSVSKETFMAKFPAPKSGGVQLEEYVEGTMMNVFWDGDEWQMASRSLIGGNGFYYKGSPTFRQMFMDAMNESKVKWAQMASTGVSSGSGCYDVSRSLDFTMFDKRFIYSFVICHPENRIVVPVKKPHLYLVEVFHLLNDGSGRVGSMDLAHPLNKEMFNEVMKRVNLPHRYELKTPSEEVDNYDKVVEEFASNTAAFHLMGVIVRGGTNGERMKFRNPVYEFVRNLRGNNPKIMFQYLHLRNTGKVAQFLRFYPEYVDQFAEYRDSVHNFTKELHNNYVNVHVKKTKTLAEVDGEFRTHVFTLHKKYIEWLSNQTGEGKRIITLAEVIQYVNELEPARLMYALNYKKRGPEKKYNKRSTQEKQTSTKEAESEEAVASAD